MSVAFHQFLLTIFFRMKQFGYEYTAAAENIAAGIDILLLICHCCCC
jgi:hypothetical protein